MLLPSSEGNPRLSNGRTVRWAMQGTPTASRGSRLGRAHHSPRAGLRTFDVLSAARPVDLAARPPSRPARSLLAPRHGSLSPDGLAAGPASTPTRSPTAPAAGRPAERGLTDQVQPAAAAA